MTDGHQDDGREGEQRESIGRLGCLLSRKHRPEHHTASKGLDAVATLRYTSVASVTSAVKTAIPLRWLMNAKNRTRRADALPLAKNECARSREITIGATATAGRCILSGNQAAGGRKIDEGK